MSGEQHVEALVFPSTARQVETPYTPGLVAILTREVGAYKDFVLSYRRLQVPIGSGELFLTNGEKVAARNVAAEALLENPQCEWLYMLDDDHKFEQHVLMRQLQLLYAEDLDVVGALYLLRVSPRETIPVGGIWERNAQGIQLRDLEWGDLPAHGNLLERRDLTVGTSGLLIRRRAFDRLTPPYFQVGQITPAKEHEDLYFGIRCQEAGLRLALNVSECIGHTARCTLWASRDEQGEWHVQLDMDPRLAGAPAREPLARIHAGTRERGRRQRQAAMADLRRS